MNIKNKTTKKIIISLLVILIIVPSILFSRPQKAHAILGAEDTVEPGPVWADILATQTGMLSGDTTANTSNNLLHLKDFAKEIIRQIVIVVGHKLLQQVTQSTVNWINSGFHGSPLFVQNPSQFFGDIGKYEVKNLIDQVGYDPRQPFGKSFALNLINQYKNAGQNDMNYSLSNVINDPVLLNNYRTNFNYGGWDGFLINTQYPQNNYLGYTMLANEKLAAKLEGTTQNAAQKVQTMLNQGSGFLSPQSCPSNAAYNNGTNEFLRPTFKNTLDFNPPACIEAPNQITGGTYCINQTDIDNYIQKYSNQYDTDKALWDANNSCPGGLVATTPGAVVANQITNALNINTGSQEMDAALGNSISAILNAFMNHFMQQGLSALSGTTNNTTAPVDNWSYYGQTLGGSNTTTGSTFVAPQSVTVKTNNKTSTTLSGGTLPYTIKTQPDSSIATAEISDTTLTVTGVSSGQTSFVVQDSSTPAQTYTVQITSNSTGTLVANFNNPSLLQNISANTESSTNITLQGGTQPYVIKTQPDSSIALALISGNTFTVVGVAPGSTSITLSDSSNPAKIITIQVTVGNDSSLSVAPQRVSVKDDGTSAVTVSISGGTAPYSIETQPDTAIASAVISNNGLVVVGMAPGTTSVTIQDSYAPAKTITIPITVTAASTTTSAGTNTTF